MKIHLITGATGFVGKYLVNSLLEKGENVWIIVRPLNGLSAQERATGLFKDTISKWPNAFRIIAGDILIEDLGMDDSIVTELKNNEVVFWHLAANLSFALTDMAVVQKTNYIGTMNVVRFVNKVAKRFVYMSTAYVCGNATSFKENDLSKGQKHRNQYESSKFEAEKYVNENCIPPFVIFRPSIIIGDAYQGKAEGCTFGYYRYTFMFYFLKKKIIEALHRNSSAASCLKIFGTKYNQETGSVQAPWLIIPYPKNGVVDMVTVDYVITSMTSLYEHNARSTTVHLTHHNPPAHHLILHSIIYDMDFRDIKLVPVPGWMFRGMARSLYYLAVPLRKYITSVMWYLPYTGKASHFDRSFVEQYGENPPEITRELLETINSYAKENILEKIEV